MKSVSQLQGKDRDLASMARSPSLGSLHFLEAGMVCDDKRCGIPGIGMVMKIEHLSARVETCP